MVETTMNNRERGRRSQIVQATASKYFAFKTWPTRAIGVVLLILAAPLIVVLVAIVRATSSGPGLYRQLRTGKGGCEFNMYKIRTMYQNAESVTGPTWCVKGDSRVTPVGKVFRLLHLDELPQLINVVRGEMDLIGPRPERPEFVAWLASEIPHYSERLRILPGVTGLAQINLPPDETTECVRKKLALDRQYIVDASLGMDLRILMCTLLRMIGIRHGRAARWLGVRYTVDSIETASHRDSTPAPMAIHRAEGVGRHAAAKVYVGNGHGGAVALSVDRLTAEETSAATEQESAVPALAALDGRGDCSFLLVAKLYRLGEFLSGDVNRSLASHGFFLVLFAERGPFSEAGGDRA